MDYIKKNGLLYSQDMHTVLGVDDTSTAFTGRIPFGAHKIDDEVFSDCPYESISLPDSVKELGNCLFENSKALEKVKLPSGITELPPYLFSGCSALTKVTMPNALTSLSEGLFKNCSALTEIPFRAGVTSLPESVFEGCSSVKSLVIPPTVTRIESKACANCTSLESVVFPAGLEFIADDAFAGCTSLHNIRLDGENSSFYINEENGSLYFADDSGDREIVKAYGVNNQGVSFFKDSVDDEPIAPGEDEEFEDDDTFSAEIGASDEEAGDFGTSAAVSNNTNKKDEGVNKMGNENVDSMLADIMGAEKERNAISEDVGISEKESAVLSEAMDVMSGSSQASAGAGITDKELENLFAKNEEQELASQNIDNPDVLDGKTQILCDAVGLSEIINCEPKGEVPEESELFVIAENLSEENGNHFFSKKLTACAKKLADIHDYKHVIMLHGLPLDNEEFMQFFYHFIPKKNVVFACDAATPSALSDYGKEICEAARINLSKEDIEEQRRTAVEKGNTLLKIIIRDSY